MENNASLGKVSSSLKEFIKFSISKALLFYYCLILALRMRQLNRGAQLIIKICIPRTSSLSSLKISEHVRSSQTC